MEKCSREKLGQFKVRLIHASVILGRLRLGTSCCGVCIGWDCTWKNRIQRNYKKLKIAADMHSWGELWSTRFTKHSTAVSEVSGAK